MFRSPPEELGLLPEDIQVINADTEITPSDPGSYSMCTTWSGDNAVRLAALDAKKKLFAVAAKKLEAKPEDLVAANRNIFVKGEPERSLSIPRLVRMALARGESVSGEGSYWPKVDPKREWVDNPTGQLSETFTFGTTIVEVKIDPETGQVEVVEAWASQDVGRAINPKVIESQFESGLVMGGHGGMLSEFVMFDKGRVLNPTQLEYKVPLACDTPKINSIIVESNDPTGHLRGKGIGDGYRHVCGPGLLGRHLQRPGRVDKGVSHNSGQDS